MSKKANLKEPDLRGQLAVRRSPYSEPMTTTKGVALLFYRHIRQNKWGVRSPLGERVICFEEEMTYEEACTALRQLIAVEAKTGAKAVDSSDDPESITFGDVWDQYMRWAESSGKTLEMMANLRSHSNVVSGIFALKVSSTPLSDLNKWRDALIGSTGTTGRKRSSASVGRALASFKAALTRAAIDGDWKELKTGVRKVAAKKRIVALMDAELATFTDAAYEHSHDFGVFVQALALTGARPKELRLAVVGDLTPEGLVIRHGKTASKTGDRTVPLSGYAMAFFKGLVAGNDPSTPLLGKSWRQGETRNAVESCAKAAGVPNATLYSMRHGFVTTAALYNNAPVRSVAAACGTSIAMIEQTYGHVIPAKERDVWEKVNPYGDRHLRVVGGET